MQYLFQFARILLFCFMGEALHAWLPLPIPPSIYGMALLFLALRVGLVRPEHIKAVGSFLTGIFLLLFVPGTVGIIEQPTLLSEIWLPLVVAILPVTALVFAVAGLVTDHLIWRSRHA